MQDNSMNKGEKKISHQIVIEDGGFCGMILFGIAMLIVFGILKGMGKI